MIPTLSSPELILRAPRESDFCVYQAFFCDAQASHFYGGPLSATNAWKQLAMDLGHWHLKGYGVWVIESKETGEVLGGCGFWWPNAWPRPELTWWLATAARGRGIATKASKLAIDFAYNQLQWQHVETHLRDDNEAARQLVIRLGGEVIAREAFPDGVDRNVYVIPQQG
ncbi:MAG: GNAT family N-acetyltransferase [Pseudomonadales bacterium]